jgi:hypothetical protein
MILLFASGLVLLALAVAAVARSIRNAPAGFEDRRGFHSAPVRENSMIIRPVRSVPDAHRPEPQRTKPRKRPISTAISQETFPAAAHSLPIVPWR